MIWVDQLAGTVNRVALDGSEGPVLTPGGRVGCALPRRDGGLMLAWEAGFAGLEMDGTFAVTAPVSANAPASFLNDAKCDRLGCLWAGSVGVGADGLAVAGSGGLHRLDPGGGVSTPLTGLSLANGLDWSPDGRTLYFVDSLSGGIDAFAFDAQAGALGARARVVELGLAPGQGFADGLCVDADGCLWAAIWGTGEVRRYTPAGRLERTIELPVSQPTSCIFAGPALDVLVVTSAGLGLDAGGREAEPLAGGLFAVTPGVTGLPCHAFGAPD